MVHLSAVTAKSMIVTIASQRNRESQRLAGLDLSLDRTLVRGLARLVCSAHSAESSMCPGR